jgi:hypothetical protein
LIVFYRPTIPGHAPCKPTGDDIHQFNWIHPVKVEPYSSYSEYKQNSTGLYQWDLFESYNEFAQQEVIKRRTQLQFPAAEDSLNMTHHHHNIHWLNVFNSSVLRRDGHIGFGDCAHSYLPGPTDSWIHFFYSALLDMVERM